MATKTTPVLMWVVLPASCAGCELCREDVMLVRDEVPDREKAAKAIARQDAQFDSELPCY